MNKPKISKSAEDWLKSQCNRYVNGFCSTMSCLNRGGYERGQKVDYDMAKCEAHEILKAINTEFVNH